MKIDNHHPTLEVHGAGGHHGHKTKQAEKAATTSPTATTLTEQAATTVSLTSEATAAADAQSPPADLGRKVPPGLARVAARFESLGEAGRSRGQSNALAQIQRHLQRYADVQELAPPVPGTDSAAPVTPITVPIRDGTSDPIAMPVDGEAVVTVEVGVEPVIAQPVPAY